MPHKNVCQAKTNLGQRISQNLADILREIRSNDFYMYNKIYQNVILDIQPLFYRSDNFLISYFVLSYFWANKKHEIYQNITI